MLLACKGCLHVRQGEGVRDVAGTACCARGRRQRGGGSRPCVPRCQRHVTLSPFCCRLRAPGGRLRARGSCRRSPAAAARRSQRDRGLPNTHRVSWGSRQAGEAPLVTAVGARALWAVQEGISRAEEARRSSSGIGGGDRLLGEGGPARCCQRRLARRGGGLSALGRLPCWSAWVGWSAAHIHATMQRVLWFTSRGATPCGLNLHRDSCIDVHNATRRRPNSCRSAV